MKMDFNFKSLMKVHASQFDLKAAAVMLELFLLFE